MMVATRTTGASSGFTAGTDMASPVITVPAAATRPQSAEILTRHRISGAPVIDDFDAAVGPVSEPDLPAKPGVATSALMTTAAISVSPDCALSDLRHLLVERRIHRGLDGALPSRSYAILWNCSNIRCGSSRRSGPTS